MNGLKGRSMDHIGVCVPDVEAEAKFYQDVLGCTIKGKFLGSHGTYTYFLQDGQTVYELYQASQPMNPAVIGKIDHISYVSNDIEEDYKMAVAAGYKIWTRGIEAIPNRWEKGCRYFKIESPNGAQVEFCQVL